MGARLIIPYILITMLSVTAIFTQIRVKKPVFSNKSRLAVGNLYRVTGGAHMHYIFLKTSKGIIHFTATREKTRWAGFRNNPNSWKTGAEWSVVYRDTSRDEQGYGDALAESVTFTGRVESSIASAETAAYEYLNQLSDKNYVPAYNLLSESAKQSVNFENFKNLYRSGELVPRIVTACSQTGDRVSLLLESEAAGNFQRVDIVKERGKWKIGRPSKFEQGFDYSIYRC